MSTLKVGEIKHESFTGTTQLKLDSAGNVLIGTTSANKRLTLIDRTDPIAMIIGENDNATTEAGLRIQARNTGNTSGFNLDIAVDADASAATFDFGGSERMRIDSSGNVGIGTSSPSSALEVVGGTGVNVLLNAATHDASTANQARLQLGYVHSGGQALGHIRLDEGGSNSFDGILRLGVPYNNQSGGSSTREVIEADFNGNICFPGSTTVFDTTARTNGLQLHYETDSGIATIASHSSGGNTMLNLGTNSSGGAVGIGMTIRETGKVGIGTTSPTGLLHTKGDVIPNAYFETTNAAGSYIQLVLGNSGAGLGYIGHSNQLNASPTTGNLALRFEGTALEFSKGSAIKARITNDGLCFGSDTAAANALDDYEEGTFTPTSSAVTLTGTIAGHYTKIGDLCYVSCIFQVPSTSSANDIEINGLPFNAKNGTDGNFIQGGYVIYHNQGGGPYTVLLQNNMNRLVVYKADGTRQTFNNFSGKLLRLAAVYKVA